MTNQPDSMEETKTSNPIQQGELRPSASARTPVEVCQLHFERPRPTKEKERKLLLEIAGEVEQIFECNADL
jgi:hypothetical protein